MEKMTNINACGQWDACRYYEDNFKKEDIEKGGGLSVMLREYVKGLCWVLKYYYQV